MTDNPASVGAHESAQTISSIRRRIDEIDTAIIHMWQERADLSQQVGAARVAAGGTRLALSRENEILERFRRAIGADGVALGLLILRAGRGSLQVARPAVVAARDAG
jgi:chorismate mutase